MSAYDRGTQKLDAYLARLLAAVCKMHDGELRIPADLMDALDERTILVKDWDATKQQVVLRLGSAFNEVYRVEGGAPWPKTIPIAPAAESPQPPQPSTASTVDDKRLVNLERQFLRQRVKTLLDLERRARAAEESH